MSKKQEKLKKDSFITRPPIVVVMGHIDHGKTTLLDFIRETKVTECEAGGITQHVGAYEIEKTDKEGKKRTITFLDTPGHEAFSKIRSRGAKIADIAILVVAADDGVKAQTEEALKTIKSAQIPFVVAINKIDKENSDPDRVKKELTEKEVFVEGWGGKIPAVNISAKTGEGLDDLLEIVLLTADIEDLKTDPSANGSGFVVESQIDKKRGTSATLIIQNGTLKGGMFVATNNSISPVRIFEDFRGCVIKEAGASSPIKITGFNELPESGVVFESFKNKKEAESTTNRNTISVDEPKSYFGLAEEEGGTKVIIPLVVKADTAGSIEALESSFAKIFKDSQGKITINIFRNGVGDINEDDVKMASSGKNAIIIGFNVNCSNDMKMMAERYDATIKLFDIIYEAEKWLKEEIEKREPAEETEENIGKAKVIKIFGDEKNKKIVGGEVVSGKITLGSHVKIFRRDYLLGEGEVIELKQQQSNKKEVLEKEQFGALIQTNAGIAPRDTLEIFEKKAT